MRPARARRLLVILTLAAGCRGREHARAATASPDAAPAMAVVGTAPGLTVVVDGTAHQLTAAQLDALSQGGAMTAKGHKQLDGWDLREILSLAGVKGRATVVAIGREGNATFTREALDAPGTTGLLRRNRRGELRLAIGATGGAETVDVHDVARLEVTTER